MIECDWAKSPSWANYFVELEGGRAFWSSEEVKDFGFSPEIHNEELPNVEDFPSFYSLSVLQCVPRPEWKTMIHFKDSGKVASFLADGMLAHGTVRRILTNDLGVDKDTRFMLEYIQVN